MIVVRHTYKVKTGCKDAFIESLKAALEEAGLTPRFYSFVSGDQDLVIVEREFESEQDHQKWKDSLDISKPKMAEWKRRQSDLFESRVTRELLRVH